MKNQKAALNEAITTLENKQAIELEILREQFYVKSALIVPIFDSDPFHSTTPTFRCKY